MPRQRLGVALLIPPPTSIEVDALRRALGDDDVDRIASHITLVPPVNVREDEIDAASKLLHDAGAACPPLRLVLGPVTTFSPINPTIHLAVAGDLEGLRALRDAVFLPPMARSLTHEFVPHVTLVEEGADRIDAAVRALDGYRAEVVVDRVHLMRESRREDGTRVWRPIADADLGRRRAVIGRGGLPLELTAGGVLPPDADRWIHDRWDDFDVERYGRVLPPNLPLSIVARRDGEIVGVADGEVRSAGEAYLAQLLVRRDVRGEGIGAHVLAAFASAAAEHGATFLSLRTEAAGRSRPFYERLGFTEWYPLPAWRNSRDFVQMRRPI